MWSSVLNFAKNKKAKLIARIEAIYSKPKKSVYIGIAMIMRIQMFTDIQPVVM